MLKIEVDLDSSIVTIEKTPDFTVEILGSEIIVNLTDEN